MILYNGTPGELLDSLRYKCLHEKAATYTPCIYPQTLPLTSAAAIPEPLIVYLQVLEWKESRHELNPLERGWKNGDDKTYTIITDLPPELLKITR